MRFSLKRCFDILQAKIVAHHGHRRNETPRHPPAAHVQLTIIDANQKMLPGTDIPTALVALEEIDEIDVIGMNCGVGPDLMLSSMRHLSRTVGSCSRSCRMLEWPETRNDETYFPLKEEPLADALEQFVGEFGVHTSSAAAAARLTRI